MEAIRISCAGYPTRRSFYEFIDRFGILAPDVLPGRYVLYEYVNLEINFMCILSHSIFNFVFY